MKKKISIYDAARAALKRRPEFDAHVAELKEKYPPKKIAKSEEGGQYLIQEIKRLQGKLFK